MAGSYLRAVGHGHMLSRSAKKFVWRNRLTQWDKKGTVRIGYLRSPLPFQQGFIWRTRYQVHWALMSAPHTTPPSQPRRLDRKRARSQSFMPTSHSHLYERGKNMSLTEINKCNSTLGSMFRGPYRTHITTKELQLSKAIKAENIHLSNVDTNKYK